EQSKTFDLVAYSDSDYAGASLDRKSTTGGYQFLRCRLISCQYKKQTVVTTSSTKAEYVAAVSCCAQGKVSAVSVKLTAAIFNCWFKLMLFTDIYLLDCISGFKLTLQDNDVTRLQSLVDKKKVVVTEAAIREVLRLDDAEGVDCLPNEEIFAELACMGYEKPSTKLTFYKSFFSSQRKFLIHTILQSMSAKRTSWNEFSSAMAFPVICLSTESICQYEESRKRILTLFEGMIVEQVIEEGEAEGEHVKEDTTTQEDDTTTQGDDAQEPSIPSSTLPTPPPQPPQDLPSTSQYDKVAQALEITKLKRRVKKLEKGNRVRVLKLRRLKKVGTSQRIDTSKDTVMDDASNQGRMIDDLDKDDVVALMDDKEEEKKEEEAKVVEDDQPQVPAATITAALLRVAAASTKRRKGVVIRDPEEESSLIIHADTKSKDKGKKIMNVAGFRLDYFKGMSYDDIRPIFEAKFKSNIEFILKTKEQMEEEESRALQSINETPAQKAAKRRKLNKEVEDLKRHLEIMPNEDDGMDRLKSRRIKGLCMVKQMLRVGSYRNRVVYTLQPLQPLS
nr:copia protein [Tanacetum cinerariifolium]